MLCVWQCLWHGCCWTSLDCKGLTSVAHESPSSPWVPSSQSCCGMDEACCRYAVEWLCILAEKSTREIYIYLYLKCARCGKCVSCSSGFFFFRPQWLSYKTEIPRKLDSDIKKYFFSDCSVIYQQHSKNCSWKYWEEEKKINFRAWWGYWLGYQVGRSKIWTSYIS